jgi:hypothetical protein
MPVQLTPPPSAPTVCQPVSSLTCPHLSNLALVQDHATNQLHVKGTKTKHTAGTLTNNLQQQQQQQKQQV